jgi:hypothetical protein
MVKEPNKVRDLDLEARRVEADLEIRRASLRRNGLSVKLINSGLSEMLSLSVMK